ncbi:MAG: division/cell wall cluster transcriptional repressor MraZ [Candidatus Omnitrophica bacterium]|jgi:MraZ protein|nr:division/cell wall cluster transcriptional repressor MraZ [Candidatus Omnitrophota bacterium]
MWYGEYLHTLDEKDRFILPAKFREKIKGFKNKKFYITRGLESCLFLVSEEVWKNLKDKLEALPFTKQQSRFFNRLFFSGASEIEIDSQGRVNVPVYLKEFAKIKREIVIIGVSERIEIWDKDCWYNFYQNNKGKFEEMGETLF